MHGQQNLKTFLDCNPAASSGGSFSMLDGNPFLQNVEENPYDNTVPHFVRLDSWIVALWKPQNSVCVLVHFMVANSLEIAYEAVLQVVCDYKHYVWMLDGINMKIWDVLIMFLHLCHKIFSVNQFYFLTEWLVCCTCMLQFTVCVSCLTFCIVICWLYWHVYCFIYFKQPQIHSISQKYS
jgi:hypothetical protein